MPRLPFAQPKRGVTINVCDIHIGAMDDEKLNHVEMAITRSVVQSRLTPAIPDVDIHSRGEKNFGINQPCGARGHSRFEYNAGPWLPVPDAARPPHRWRHVVRWS